MVLNEAVDFDVAADCRVRRAFVGGRPEAKIKLDAGTKLYKWTQHPLITPQGISPWWHIVDGRLLPNGLWVEGFRQSEIRAQRRGKLESFECT